MVLGVTCTIDSTFCVFTHSFLKEVCFALEQNSPSMERVGDIADSSHDEDLHCLFACVLNNHLLKPPCSIHVREIVDSAIQIKEHFICKALPFSYLTEITLSRCSEKLPL
jgi:hypothetical protein